MDDCVELVAERVALIGDGVIAGGHAVHGQQTEAGLRVHLVDVVVDRKADGVGGVVVLGDAVHEAAHVGGGKLGGRGHQLAVALVDEQLFEEGLTARVHTPLERHDGGVCAAHVLPAGDAARINIPQLLLGQALDGILFVDDEDQRIPADGFLLELCAGLGQLFLDVLGGLVDDEELCAVVLAVAAGPEAEVLPGIGRGADGDAGLGLEKVHAGDVGLHLGHQGDAGRGAVEAGELVLGQEGDGRVRIGDRRRRRVGGGVRSAGLAGSEHRRPEAEAHHAQEAAAGDHLFHIKNLRVSTGSPRQRRRWGRRRCFRGRATGRWSPSGRSRSPAAR